MRVQNILGIKAQMPVGVKASNPGISGNGCSLPQNQYSGNNPTNPTSLYSQVSTFMSGLMGAESCVESSITDGILTGNPNFNPQEAIHKKFQIAALLGKAYDRLKEIIERQKEFLKSLKDAYNPALAAR